MMIFGLIWTLKKVDTFRGIQLRILSAYFVNMKMSCKRREESLIRSEKKNSKPKEREERKEKLQDVLKKKD
jgi:hypothetical protein